MKLLLAIATYKRPEKLLRCLNSIMHSTYKNYDVLIIADNNDFETETLIKEISDYPFGGNKLSVVVQPKQSFVIGAWNKAIQEHFINGNYDAFLGLCDDVELKSNCLEQAVRNHQKWFKDGDGVIGLNQECHNHPEYTFKWFGQTLMGRKFIDRYIQAKYQICCPDYFHFMQDEEMFTFANSIGKFMCAKEAILYHDHPSFTGNTDETHHLIRNGKNSPKKHDFEMQKKRQLKGYCWGKDFNLIGEEDGR